jgi:hypothetical protein
VQGFERETDETMRVIHRPVLVDAKEMNRKHPDSFHLPPMEELQLLSKGDFVKVCDGFERFWIEIEKIKDGSILGRVDNYLLPGDFNQDDLVG